MASHVRRVCTNPVAPSHRIGPGKHDTPHLGVKSFIFRTGDWLEYLEALFHCRCICVYLARVVAREGQQKN